MRKYSHCLYFSKSQITIHPSIKDYIRWEIVEYLHNVVLSATKEAILPFNFHSISIDEMIMINN
jgi:2-hydroxy-3-keto-5-methylthiopentenyl-1-phosphate phosphatase